MNEKTTDILEKYRLKISHVQRARGGFICNTNEGLKFFKEYKGNEKHLIFEEAILEKLKQQSNVLSDFIVKNVDGELITQNEEAKYILKEWFQSRECNIWDKSDIYKACAMLGEIHTILNGKLSDNLYDLYPCSIISEFERHTTELKRAYKYIRNKNNKNEFERKVLANFDKFYKKAEEALEMTKKIDYNNLRKKAYDNQSVCHGSFNYHNILIVDKKAVLVNYERAVIDVQITDLYDFIRKVMEKYNWDIELGHKMIEEYNAVRKLSEEEKRLLYVMIMYPEKFWKIVNQYYNSNKSWLPESILTKLVMINNQEDKKQRFIDTFDFI